MIYSGTMYFVLMMRNIVLVLLVYVADDYDDAGYNCSVENIAQRRLGRLLGGDGGLGLKSMRLREAPRGRRPRQMAAVLVRTVVEKRARSLTAVVCLSRASVGDTV